MIMTFYFPAPHSGPNDDDAHKSDACVPVYWQFVSGLLGRRDVPPERVTHAVDAVKEAVGKVTKVSKLTEARQWVANTLAAGPMQAIKLDKLAKSAGIAPRTLRRALKALKVQHRRNRDKTWSLSLVQAEPEEGQGS
jgi:hypothetical protein